MQTTRELQLQQNHCIQSALPRRRRRAISAAKAPRQLSLTYHILQHRHNVLLTRRQGSNHHGKHCYRSRNASRRLTPTLTSDCLSRIYRVAHQGLDWLQRRQLALLSLTLFPAYLQLLLQAFLNAGVQGLTVVDLSPTSLDTALATFSTSDQAKVLLIKADVSKEDEVENYVTKTVERFGQLDISVQNAGMTQKPVSVLDQDVDQFMKVLDVNVKGRELRKCPERDAQRADNPRFAAFLGVKFSVRAMLASPSCGKGCSIIITGSQLGLDGSFCRSTPRSLRRKGYSLFRDHRCRRDARLLFLKVCCTRSSTLCCRRTRSPRDPSQQPRTRS